MEEENAETMEEKENKIDYEAAEEGAKENEKEQRRREKKMRKKMRSGHENIAYQEVNYLLLPRLLKSLDEILNY